MKKTNNPHDKVFKNLIRNKVFAQAFVKQHSSQEMLTRFDIDSMELWNASYVEKEKGKEYHSDVVYKVNTTDGIGYIVFHFEHQSKPEKLLPFRTLQYGVFLMDQHLKQGHDKLPIIIPVVFYNGTRSPYPFSTDIFECFENPALAKQYFMQPFKLVDVTIISDEQLKQNIVTAPLQLIMKHIRDKDLLPYIQSLATDGILEQNAHLNSGTLLMDVVQYIIQRGEISNPEAFKDLLLNHSGEARRPIMTIYEQHQQEVNDGIQKEKHFIAKNLLNEQLDLALIAKATHLSIEEIKKLKEDLEGTKH